VKQIYLIFILIYLSFTGIVRTGNEQWPEAAVTWTVYHWCKGT